MSNLLFDAQRSQRQICACVAFWRRSRKDDRDAMKQRCNFERVKISGDVYVEATDVRASSGYRVHALGFKAGGLLVLKLK